MAFSVQAIRYGWMALTALGIITGTTIYVLNNTRQQVKPEDVIEIALGTYERCLATQTATNPTYSVTPPSFVRTWTSNVYTTNGVTVYTNIVTNTIGWRVDRDMMVSLDTTIKALVSYYVDANTVYDGTTNIVMLTVTGLWASLGIGDKTNQFTRTPCWTNPVSTNWVVNYTSYWPSTNGTATNINYTSDYRQVVNYAQSWTVTGGHVWVTSSNWASSVVTVTNVATYGDYPWQIYVEDLQERYKVLNALKMVRLSDKITYTNYDYKITDPQGSSYEDSVTKFAAASWQPRLDDQGILAVMDNIEDTWNQQRNRAKHIILGGYTTNVIINKLSAFSWLTKTQYGYSDDPIIPGTLETWLLIKELTLPTASIFPFTDSIWYGNSEEPIPNPEFPGEYSFGWSLGSYTLKFVFLDMNFNYCTDKYW